MLTIRTIQLQLRHQIIMICILADRSWLIGILIIPIWPPCRQKAVWILASLSADPSFTSDTDLHASAELLDLAGTPLAAVTDDIDGESRDPFAPDIGADEFGQSSGADTEFISLDTDLPGFSAAKASWGDYDNDGQLDLLLTGTNDMGSLAAQIFHNENGNFYDIAADLTGVGFGSAEWGDYDNDGDLDALITGQDISGNGLSKVYRNDGNNIFNDITADLVSVYHSDAAWGDYDNDGDLDILISGATSGFPVYNPVTKIYRNDGNDNFNEVTAIDLPGYDHCAVAWGDYDNDGDQDFVVLLVLINQKSTVTLVVMYLSNRISF